MRVKQTTIEQVRIGFGPKQKMKDVKKKRTAYVCPNCGKLVSYIPLEKIDSCVYCGTDLEWDGLIDDDDEDEADA